MQLRSLDHIEFYVGDPHLAAFYLCNAFGFARTAEAGPESGVTDHRSLLVEQGEIRFVLTAGLTASHPATTYVARHGDGVANVAFGTPDAAGAFHELVDRGAVPVDPPRVEERGGAQIVTASVAGFGDVIHRLVERQGEGEPRLPGFVVVQPEVEPPAPILREVDHIAVCLPAGELARTARLYRNVFDFKHTFSERIEVGAQAMDSQVVQSPSETVTLTLIGPVRTQEPGQIDTFLARHGGAGVQHVALATDDIVTAVRTLRSRGVRFLATPDEYYDDLRDRMGIREDTQLDLLREAKVLMDRDSWGELFQIFSESVHVRRTYFSEIIARAGARTFGAHNIRALYRAVAGKSGAA
jgi:4-hydroxymandelate synthase